MSGYSPSIQVSFISRLCEMFIFVADVFFTVYKFSSVACVPQPIMFHNNLRGYNSLSSFTWLTQEQRKHMVLLMTPFWPLFLVTRV